jgi:hypothetical protein
MNNLTNVLTTGQLFDSVSSSAVVELAEAYAIPLEELPMALRLLNVRPALVGLFT